jgi:hypothetical protein
MTLSEYPRAALLELLLRKKSPDGRICIESILKDEENRHVRLLASGLPTIFSKELK